LGEFSGDRGFGWGDWKEFPLNLLESIERGRKGIFITKKFYEGFIRDARVFSNEVIRKAIGVSGLG
jgi:hypothetical protein